ncbi:hypothetical protein HELRODRAFT_176092 [Helobdella robusta]|uniref:CCHC-type domain-containing protein n=1 Tax=Helobdella robusta TaxID=6412 RepID=T1FA47_HELRO|nr:hypothetical protein HELRODRAFT_176092 [Helobdella robusta]ESO00240.1 hypothetical protein HELRODRAFT_176092 [Helobdella robusta]
MLESDHLEESRNDACEEYISARRKKWDLRPANYLLVEKEHDVKTVWVKRSSTTRRTTETKPCHKGNKEVLVARLRKALIDEGKNPDEFKFDGADEDNEISTGTTAKMMELLLSMSTEIKQQIKEQFEQIKEQSERLTEELKQIKEQSRNSPNEHRDETALDTFIKALRDSELKQSLLLSDKRKLKDAVVVKREPQQHGVPQCWICGEKGHLRRDCKHRLKDNYFRNCATRWRKRREDDPVSRSAPSLEGAEN